MLLMLLIGSTFGDLKNYKVNDIFNVTKEQLVTLHKIKTENREYEFLTLARHSHGTTKVLVPPEWNSLFKYVMESYSLNFTLITQYNSQSGGDFHEIRIHEIREKAFSEPETKVVRDIMHHYGGRLKWYLNLYSYGNYILLPWGHTIDLPHNYFAMVDVADAGAMAIVVSTGGVYTYGNTYHVMYPTSGNSADYAAAALNTPVSMCMELPAGGFLGFDPTVRQIEDIVSETWIGIKAMAEVVVEKY